MWGSLVVILEQVELALNALQLPLRLDQADDGTTEIVGVVQRAATEEAPNGRLGFADEVEGFQGYVFTGLATRAPEGQSS